MSWTALAPTGVIGLCLMAGVAPMHAEPAVGGVVSVRCPAGAIDVAAGASIADAVERAGEGAVFCLKNGVHRLQIVRPKRNQHFYGEGNSVLNGSRVLTSFTQEDRYWVASGMRPSREKDRDCVSTSPACNVRESVFIDDRALAPVQSKAELEPGRFYVDDLNDRLYLADDPAGHVVEATVVAAAFDSFASGVSISNLIIEKYASMSQRGAVQARYGVGWTIENCEIRWNSGGGIGAGDGTQIRFNNIHHNGQIGVTGVGKDVVIENNRIWANNTRGFDFTWEAGGVKLAVSENPVFRANSVYDNVGPGLWCDISCRNALYEGNRVEGNHDAGIFFEISFGAIIRNNIVRHNGISSRKWFWGAEVLVAGSQTVTVENNDLTVSPGGCAIVLVDQSRRIRGGGKYKTRDDIVRDNVITFEGAACAGGVSDAPPGDENFDIIASGGNHFDHNTYIIPQQSGPARFGWDHSVFGWDEFRGQGQEPNGTLLWR
ncbi:right-handed parallel beta-helix repeat-containing protein [Bradyrhizobium sp. NP1]|uniref:right-handed parallel beta-helix repeat-containing protein n=1 Tax=Bradyrhizobium sp. NP1 TaxID=3049772 RepID=UPI0025A56985|nr:right-handed parallel beta-helix repeat-containing protein [Bradyrhizobium sp. NP1]WJR77318.1 right-handed parallel beta-helix repeat-containing protein [Bradyrhizobium sp. NP1]